MVSEKSLKRPRYQEPDWRSNKYVKRNVVVEVDEESDNHSTRRWEEMDHEILVSIMKRSRVLDLVFSFCFVCKSWMDATLDTLFPPQDVLNLGNYPMLRHSYHRRIGFGKMIQLHLNRDQARIHTKLVLSNISFNKYGYRYIAKRLPSVRSVKLLIDSNELPHYSDGASYWKGLVELDCTVSSITIFSGVWNQIHTLRLHGHVNVTDAFVIARNFPRLTHLSLKNCTLMGNALSLILDGQKNLIYLDTTHAILCEEKFSRAKDWDEDLLLKASRITQFLRCEMRNCRFCNCRYRPL